VKIGTGDTEWWNRLQKARADGRVTSMSGLGKQALAHASVHGQKATEALLRGNEQPAQAGIDVEQRPGHGPCKGAEAMSAGHRPIGPKCGRSGR
jgi:hypothetical protein